MTRTELQEILKKGKEARFVADLYHCNACVRKIGDVYFLQSYRTIVAVYDPCNDEVYTDSYYSSTTCQHTAKFRTWLYQNGIAKNPWLRTKRLYATSGMSKKMQKELDLSDYDDGLNSYEMEQLYRG